MNKKCIFTFILLGLFGSIYSPYGTTVIKTTLIPKEACSIGSGSVSVKATATDKTSGVNGWLCYNSNGSWVSCPNSTLCSTYTINGWNNYTKVKINDNAGNESNEATLYKSSSYRFNGTATNSNLITRSGDSNVVNITGQTATTGTISSTAISSTGNVSVSGYPKGTSVTTSTPVSYNASKEEVYSCNVGNVVYRNGKYMCEAESYRLQNETCNCFFKKENGKYVRATSWCARMDTYCSDEYSSTASESDTYAVITNRKPNAQTSQSTTAQSNLFIRPAGTTCFTYYEKDGNGKSFAKIFNDDDIWHSCYAAYESTTCFLSSLHKSMGIKVDETTGHQSCCENNNYAPLKVKPGIRKLLVEASKSTSSPCDNSNPKNTVTGTGYFSSATNSALCEFIANKLNTNSSFAESVRFEAAYEDDKVEKIMVPTFGSAACKFKSGEATKTSAPNSNSKIGTIGNTQYYFYCPDGSSVTQSGNNFTCTRYQNTTITTYAYDWTVYYYKKK